MDFDIDGTTAADPEPEYGQRLGIRALFVDTILRPVSAMRHLADHPDRRWLVPLAMLVLFSVAAAAASLPAKQRYDAVLARIQIEQMRETNPQAAEMAEQFTGQSGSGGTISMIGGAMALLGAAIGPLVGALAGAAVLHFLGTILGGQQTYSQMLSATAWARIPLIFQAGLRCLSGLAGGYDPYPNGLAGLVAPDPAQSFASPSVWGPVLAQISIWHLWALLLFVIAVRVVAHVSLRKALTAVIIYVVLIVLLGEVGVGLGKFGARFGASMAQVG